MVWFGIGPRAEEEAHQLVELQHGLLRALQAGGLDASLPVDTRDADPEPLVGASPPSETGLLLLLRMMHKCTVQKRGRLAPREDEGAVLHKALETPLHARRQLPATQAAVVGGGG